MELIKWGIIGCGDVAEVKSGPAFQQAANSELLAVMRRSEKKVKDFAQRHKIPYYYTDADKLLTNAEINSVYIATPPNSHLDLAIKALKAGKNVYLEKPMVLNNEEAKVLSKAAISANAKITIAHYRRALPAFLKVKELLKKNVIGNIRLVEINILQSAKAGLVARTEENWRVLPAISGGGYFFDLAPHQIDLMLNYFGPPAKVFGYGSNQSNAYPANDIVSGQIIFESGVHFHGTWAFNVSKNQEEDTCKIFGSKGMISFSFYGDTVVVDSEKREIFKFQNPSAIQLPMIQRTVDYFLGYSPDNPCSVKEAANVIDIMTKFSGTSK